jgi:hypothetical protein
MTVGPLEYLVIGFDDNQFDGRIVGAIEKVVENRTIRLVDVIFVGHDEKGEAAIVELDNTDDPRSAAFKPILADRTARFTPEDLVAISESIPLGASGLALLFEHRWAEELKDALTAAGGFLIDRVVIPPDVLPDVSADLEAATVSG